MVSRIAGSSTGWVRGPEFSAKAQGSLAQHFHGDAGAGPNHDGIEQGSYSTPWVNIINDR